MQLQSRNSLNRGLNLRQFGKTEGGGTKAIDGRTYWERRALCHHEGDEQGNEEAPGGTRLSIDFWR